VTRRERLFTFALQLVTATLVIGLLIYSVAQSNRLADERAQQAIEEAQRNRRLIHGLDDILHDIRAAQVSQRMAFRALARRNERLHGRDPDKAPRFDPVDPDGEAASTPSPSPQPTAGPPAQPRPRPEPDPPRRRPRPTPSPTPGPSPSPSPQVCVPVIDVCVSRADGGPDDNPQQGD
jgi:outer membrane biosynthesis protein TonB